MITVPAFALAWKQLYQTLPHFINASGPTAGQAMQPGPGAPPPPAARDRVWNLLVRAPWERLWNLLVRALRGLNLPPPPRLQESLKITLDFSCSFFRESCLLWRGRLYKHVLWWFYPFFVCIFSLPTSSGGRGCINKCSVDLSNLLYVASVFPPPLEGEGI